MQEKSLGVFRILAGGGILLLGFLMMIFTSSHTVNFIQLSIPNDNQITAYAALAAFDLGMIIWLFALMFHATADGQKAVSGIMVFVSMAGMLAAYAADTFLIAGKRGNTAKIDQGTVDVVLWITVVVVALNVGAAVLYHILDPDGATRANIARSQAMLRRRQKEAEAHVRLREAEIEIKMKEAELAHIDENADLIGQERARARAAAWAQKIRRQTEEELPELPESRRGAPIVDAPEVREVSLAPKPEKHEPLADYEKTHQVAKSAREAEKVQNKRLRQNEIARAKNWMLGQGAVPDHVAAANKEIKKGGLPMYSGSPALEPKAKGNGKSFLAHSETVQVPELVEKPSRFVKVQGVTMKALRSKADQKKK